MFEAGWVHSVIEHGVAFGPTRSARQKRIERMVRNSDDPVRNSKTNLPHGFTIDAFEAASRGHRFIGVVHMNNSSANWQPQCGQQINCAKNVVMTVQNVIGSAPQLRAKGMGERCFADQRTR